MIEHYQANVIWIGRRPYDAAIESKINSLTRRQFMDAFVNTDGLSAPIPGAAPVPCSSYPLLASAADAVTARQTMTATINDLY